MTPEHKKLVLVAGAAGEIGTSFIAELLKRNIDVIALIRKRPVMLKGATLTTIRCELTSLSSIKTALQGVDFHRYDEVIFLHTIGCDKYDARGYPHLRTMPTIDPDVYDTNVNTFKYPLRYLMHTIEELRKNGASTSLKIAIIGGVADKYAPFVIEAFCEAKFICRQYIRSALELRPKWTSGLVINISSTITQAALKVRPFANLTYWLKAEEVAQQSVEKLIESSSGYEEISIIKKSPHFTEGYYEDHEALFQKWSRETGTAK